MVDTNERIQITKAITYHYNCRQSQLPHPTSSTFKAPKQQNLHLQNQNLEAVSCEPYYIKNSKTRG